MKYLGALVSEMRGYGRDCCGGNWEHVAVLRCSAWKGLSGGSSASERIPCLPAATVFFVKGFFNIFRLQALAMLSCSLTCC